jgi:hypothetical protein
METKLTIDDLLSNMAVPVTQLDFKNTHFSEFNALIKSVQAFIKNRRISGYTKEGLRALFETQWLPTLSDADKMNIINAYKIFDGVDDEGFVRFNEEWYLKYKQTMESYHPLKYKAHAFNGKSSSMELIEDRQYVTYCSYEKDGYWSVDLEISKEIWAKIIKNASKSIKNVLQCYLQVYPERKAMQELEVMFGINWHSINACVIQLGRRTQRMLNFAVVDPNGHSRFWSTAMTRGRAENGFFVWEPRPELMEAAKEVLEEENFPKLKQI